MNVYTWRIVSTTVLTLQAKKYSNFLILLSKIAEIHALKKLKFYKLAPISTQIFFMVRSNEQLLNDNQSNG